MLGAIKLKVKDVFAMYIMLMFLLVSFLVSGIDPNIMIILQLLFVVAYALSMKWPNIPHVIVIGLTVLVLSKLFYVFTLNPLLASTSDEVKYYGQMLAYKHDLMGFYSYVFAEMQQQIRISAIPAYGVMYMPFYSLLSYDDSIFINVFNSIILISLIYTVYRIYDKHFMWQLEDANRNKFQRLVILFLFISPVFMYWTSTFSKDVPSIFITFLTLYCLLNKRYFFFLLFLIYGTMLRPYTIVFVVGYYLVVKKQLRLAMLGVIFSLAVVFWVVGVPGVLNVFYSTAYLLMAPSPLDLANWISYPLIVPEVIFLLVMFGMSAHVYFNKKETRSFYQVCLCFLLIYACVQVLNGHAFVSGREWEYTVGQVGDNLNRKKLPMIILYYTVAAYTLVHFKAKKLIIRLR